jgi:sulfate adenylyltransferase (ADP) / ATP adenylyltransferase
MERGTLWKRIRKTTEQAVTSGALLPIRTNQAVIDEEGVRFLVRVLESLKRKDEARWNQDRAPEAKPNPFLPPEPDLLVGPVSSTHVAVLNKFNVVENHLLIVTREFEEQTMLLTPADFEALWACMVEYDSLGFYNGGPGAGASQRHKHLQVVPLPFSPEGPSVPVEPLFPSGPGGQLTRVPKFPFLNVFTRLDPGLAYSPSAAARETYGLYCRMLSRAGMKSPVPDKATIQSLPYCLLVTRSWMLLVPRSRELTQGVSLNALAFAGSFFVRDREQLEQLRSYGVMNALRDVSLAGQL